MLPAPLTVIQVRARPGRRSQGVLVAGPFQLRVALGRSGIKANKREGDGATPAGCFHPVRVWWRPDRGPRPATGLPLRRIGRDDAWSEDPADRRYNRAVKRATHAAGDRLWRDDHLYDLILEIDHNARPRISGRGSAVFLHVARPGLTPTAGCVAFTPSRLRWLLARLTPRTQILIR